MSKSHFTQAFLEQVRAAAREKSRQDKSKSYLQWLDHLCGEHGFTYTSLKRRIEDLEVAQVAAIEDDLWRTRLADCRVWGHLPAKEDHMPSLPVHDDGNVPWPGGFIESRLFSLASTGLRRMVSGPVYRMDGLPMSYEGEELRLCHDQTLLMAFVLVSRDAPCGALVRGSLQSLERVMGGPLTELGIPVSHVDIERSLWRLTNGLVTFHEYSFDGPLLAYADARRAPDYFEFAFNPDFAYFYYPLLPHMTRRVGDRG